MPNDLLSVVTFAYLDEKAKYEIVQIETTWYVISVDTKIVRDWCETQLQAERWVTCRALRTALRRVGEEGEHFPAGWAEVCLAIAKS